MLPSGAILTIPIHHIRSGQDTSEPEYVLTKRTFTMGSRWWADPFWCEVTRGSAAKLTGVSSMKGVAVSPALTRVGAESGTSVAVLCTAGLNSILGARVTNALCG
jgi:hypothetical protein